MNKHMILAALAAAVVVVPVTANAETEGCEVVDYQGAPLEMCPPVEPDPTNCYTGDYQGAPIEVCMPSGWTPDPSWTFEGEPIVMHVSKDYVPPVVETPAPSLVVAAPAPLDVSWVADYLALLG